MQKQSQTRLPFSFATLALVLSIVGILSPMWNDETKATEVALKEILKAPKKARVVGPTVVAIAETAMTGAMNTPCKQVGTHYQSGIASWYGEYFQGKTMSNKQPFDMHAYTVAHRKLPLGTRICVSNPANGRSVVATVTDRGPYVEPRVIDLSMRIATDLGIGLDPVDIFVL